MLEELSVRNYALIDNLTLGFESAPALNIITGETGAGKSIIVGSLGFILGGKAAGGCIRTGAEEASVSATVLVKERNNELLNWLDEREIELDEGRLYIRRSIKSSGRSSIYVQNIPVSRNDLEFLTGFLFDIHGQHEHESLLRREEHRKYLDRFAGLEAEVQDFHKNFRKLAEKRSLFEAQLSSVREREEKIELLTFAADEIEKAGLKSGESRKLEDEAARLSSYEKLTGFTESVCSAFFEGEESVLALSRKGRGALENAAAIDSSLLPLSERVSALYFEAEDIAGELRSYAGKLSFDPARLEEIEERLSLIYKLKKKYAGGTADGGGTPEDKIMAYRERALLEITSLSSSEEDREKLKEEIAALERELSRRAPEISAKRRAAADDLSLKITDILSCLGMKDASFGVRLSVKEKNQGEGGEKPSTLVCGPYGADDIEFLFSANRGEPLKELSRIASGGELSRVMLAIKTVLTENSEDSPDTLIFDEIDTGIGGEVAIAVADYLSRVAKKKQVFYVTHLASIACRADRHLLVEKKAEGGRTITTVKNLDGGERQLEIARMLSGGQSETALRHAEELLGKYGK